jgi:glyoxylase-like metal-dependent hydrolase (beta-lactamase superfamily II)
MDVTRVGNLLVQPILDGIARLTPSMFTVDGEPTDWTNHAHLLEPDGKLLIPVGAYVVRVGDEVVLLDAGVGDVHDDMFDGGDLLTNLIAAGVQPSDVTTVFVSHLHSDHYGWLERDGAAVFSNATIRIGAADWQHYVAGAHPKSQRAERLRAVEDHVELIDHDGQRIAAGITSRSTPGHTPGHQSVVISDGDERLIVLGDALHCPAQLTETEWQFAADVDPDLAKRTRAALLREADDPNTALLPMHFPGMTSARLLPATGTRRWVLGG